MPQEFCGQNLPKRFLDMAHAAATQLKTLNQDTATLTGQLLTTHPNAQAQSNGLQQRLLEVTGKEKARNSLGTWIGQTLVPRLAAMTNKNRKRLPAEFKPLVSTYQSIPDTSLSVRTLTRRPSKDLLQETDALLRRQKELELEEINNPGLGSPDSIHTALRGATPEVVSEIQNFWKAFKAFPLDAVHSLGPRQRAEFEDIQRLASTRNRVFQSNNLTVPRSLTEELQSIPDLYNLASTSEGGRDRLDDIMASQIINRQAKYKESLAKDKSHTSKRLQALVPDLASMSLSSRKQLPEPVRSQVRRYRVKKGGKKLIAVKSLRSKKTAPFDPSSVRSQEINLTPFRT
jgi:hypothetical protein